MVAKNNKEKEQSETKKKRKLRTLAKAMSHCNLTLEQKLLNIKILILENDIGNMSETNLDLDQSHQHNY